MDGFRFQAESPLPDTPATQRAEERAGTPIRRVFAEAIVRADQTVIANVVPKQSSEVPFVQRNHMVQQLPAAASDPSFSHSVLPERFATRALGLQSMERRVFRTSASNLVSRS